MKDKKGFTIVELLITIAVVVSILAIAILAFSKISNKHVASSWDEVKSEMKLAATQYLEVNEYLINDIKEDESVYITLETLINSDYLAVVTNPVTGEQLDKCDVVKVNKQREYTYLTKSEAIGEIGEEYFANGCTIEPTVVSESERPKLTVSIYKAANADCAIGAEYKKFIFTTSRSETTNWFNKENSPYGIVVKLALSNGSKFNVTYNDGKLNYSNYSTSSLNICTKQDQNMNDLNIKFGNNVTASVKINLDLNAPVIKVGASKTNVLEQAKNYTSNERYYNSSWYNGYVWVGATATDSNSNVKTLTYTRTKDNSLGGSDPKSIQIDNNSRQAVIKDYSAQEGISNYSYKACDEAGNCTNVFEYCNENNSCSAIDKFIVMLDHTAPVVNMYGYITNETNDILDSLSPDAENQGVSKTALFNSYINNNKVKTINSGTWTNKTVAVKPSYSDKLSGVSTSNSNCVDPRTDKTKYPDFISYRRVMNSWEGEYKFNCEIKDNAGNKTNGSYVVKRDVTGPDISYFTLSSVEVSNPKNLTSKYSSYLVRPTWSMTDKYSNIGLVKTSKNLYDPADKDFKDNLFDYSPKNKKTWTFSNGVNRYFKLASGFDGTTAEPTLQACDVLGNCSKKKASSYKVTTLACELITSTEPCTSSAQNEITGQVKIKCNAPVNNKIVATYTYYNGNTAVCNVNATRPYTLKGEQNVAVFNFRGCEGTYILKKSKFNVGSSIEIPLDYFDTKADEGSSTYCNPDKGAHTEY